MSARIPVNSFGSSFIKNDLNSQELTVKRAEVLFVNQNGDTLTGDLNMGGNKYILIQIKIFPFIILQIY